MRQRLAPFLGMLFVVVSTLVLHGPTLALVLSTFRECGEERWQWGLATAAMTLLDPLTWDAVGRSLVVALAAVTVSVPLGTGLGLILGRFRLPGGRLAPIVSLSPIAVATPFTALGWVALTERLALAQGGWTQFLAVIGIQRIGWVAWFGTAVILGTTWIAVTVVRRLGELEARWIDSALTSGAHSRHILPQILLPWIRNEVAGAAGVVFGLVLTDPSVPLLFGIRRSLGFLLVELAFAPDQTARLATLGLVALLLALLIAAVLNRLAPPVEAILSHAEVEIAPKRRLGPILATLATLPVLAWTIVAWLPAGTLIWDSFQPPTAIQSALESQSAHGSASYLDLIRPGPIRSIVLQSLGLSLMVGCFCLTLAPIWIELRSVGRSRVFGLPIRTSWLPGLGRYPPLLVALGALLASRLVLAQLRGLGLDETVDWVLPLTHERRPWVMWVWAASLVQFPMALLAADRVVNRSHEQLFDLARTLGARDGRARRDAREWLYRSPMLIALGLIIARASTGAELGLVIFQTTRDQTIGPGSLILALRDGGGLAAASIPATVGILMGVVAWGVASLARHPRAGHWLSGPR